MDFRTALYRVGSYLKHQLTARHTGGHGIHSPYLFEWVRMVMADDNSYYAWAKIEEIREQLLRDEREVTFVDYGSGRALSSSPADANKRLVKDIAKGSLAQKKYAQMLARLVRWLGSANPQYLSKRKEDRGLNIVELGTSLGVTTAYLATMNKGDKVLTFEGCNAVAEIAKENWKLLEINNIECCVGEVTEESLRLAVVDLQGGLDVAFIDANHTYEGTKSYFNVLAEKVHEKTVIVVDDIHYNQAMEKAWMEICADERVTSTMDLYQMGMVFFDKHYWKRNYKIRL